MSKRKKIAMAAILLVSLVSSSAFSQTELKHLQKRMEDFSDSLAKSLPFNASIGLNWSDAYIGKFFPGVPPHLGIGASFGFTTIDMAAADHLAEALGFNIPFDTEKLMLPVYAGEIRLGGFFLPFDIGVKAGVLQPVELWGSSINTSHTLFGTEVRYALTEGGVILPKISLGVGFNYLKGGLEASVGQDVTYNIGGTNTIAIHRPDVNLFWNTLALDFKVQVSKSLLIVTPYIGLGASYAWSEAGYEAKAQTPINQGGNVQDYLTANGLGDMDITGNKISSTIKVNGFSARAFGGLSLNLAILKLDLTGLYNFRDSNYGFSFGVRFQL
ncbi:MAG: hypothetical protein LBQ67_02105 [Treponema sp.]|jgi:hypothetical protein|nr:hypothetical protein [Treponema sp.]